SLSESTCLYKLQQNLDLSTTLQNNFINTTQKLQYLFIFVKNKYLISKINNTEKLQFKIEGIILAPTSIFLDNNSKSKNEVKIEFSEDAIRYFPIIHPGNCYMFANLKHQKNKFSDYNMEDNGIYFYFF